MKHWHSQSSERQFLLFDLIFLVLLNSFFDLFFDQSEPLSFFLFVACLLCCLLVVPVLTYRQLRIWNIRTHTHTHTHTHTKKCINPPEQLSLEAVEKSTGEEAGTSSMYDSTSLFASLSLLVLPPSSSPRTTLSSPHPLSPTSLLSSPPLPSLNAPSSSSSSPTVTSGASKQHSSDDVSGGESS